MSEVLSLYELNQMIRGALERSFPDTFLVTAEIASCDVKNHCYLTLVEKEGEIIRAEIRAVIWSNRYSVIAPVFARETGMPLSKGIRILFQASVSFHERYGLKLNIHNIDPSYTIGELAVRRKEILDRLTREGLINKNRELEFPLVPQRIGIISSSTAAGFEDLTSHLTGNPYGYLFQWKLYEAVMQGDRAEASIVSALEQCLNDTAGLDLIVIVRGGGGQTDLHCFDSYEIGRTIAMLPLPVISGIGHQRDVTVVDEVANQRAKTPTAAADMIIAAARDFEDRVDRLAYRLVHGSLRCSADIREFLASLARRLERAARSELLVSSQRIGEYSRGLRYALKFLLNEKQRLSSRESIVGHLNPRNVMKRGYSITYSSGRAVRAAADVEKGAVLKTVLYQGEIDSTVKATRKGRRKL